MKQQAVGLKSRPDKTFNVAMLGGHMCNIMNKKYSTENNFISAIDLISLLCRILSVSTIKSAPQREELGIRYGIG